MASTNFVFRADRKTKMVALATDWLHLCNGWMEFNETWKEASDRYSTSSTKFVYVCCFSADHNQHVFHSKKGVHDCGPLGLLFIEVQHKTQRPLILSYSLPVNMGRKRLVFPIGIRNKGESQKTYVWTVLYPNSTLISSKKKPNKTRPEKKIPF